MFAYLLGLATLPALALLWLAAIYASILLDRGGWVARTSIYDDRDDHRVIKRSHRSLGLLHAGRRTWWHRAPIEPLGGGGVEGSAHWVGIGRFGGRGLYVARAQR